MADVLALPLASRLARVRLSATLAVWRRTVALLGGPEGRAGVPVLARPWPDPLVPVPTDKECRACRALALPLPGGPAVWMAARVGAEHRGAMVLDYVPGRRAGWRATIHRHGGRRVVRGSTPMQAVTRAVYTGGESWRPALTLGDMRHACAVAERLILGDADRAPGSE